MPQWLDEGRPPPPRRYGARSLVRLAQEVPARAGLAERLGAGPGPPGAGKRPRCWGRASRPRPPPAPQRIGPRGPGLRPRQARRRIASGSKSAAGGAACRPLAPHRASSVSI
eukprot:3041234-Pyramimonas_sp.AAC.2